ncbi:hypothetical protein DPEC_G00262310 [Dallia pectoralis]|uniref:Uncharacterized protein n=1 Tax=Dallia pectoralis TaxID=75939 RepID=A0ACC2FRM5_DALPE|nr:hypothetical protein DPEC_G00262310 [Dallia pectoralis]
MSEADAPGNFRDFKKRQEQPEHDRVGCLSWRLGGAPLKRTSDGRGHGTRTGGGDEETPEPVPSGARLWWDYSVTRPGSASHSGTLLPSCLERKRAWITRALGPQGDIYRVLPNLTDSTM